MIPRSFYILFLVFSLGLFADSANYSDADGVSFRLLADPTFSMGETYHAAAALLIDSKKDVYITCKDCPNDIQNFPHFIEHILTKNWSSDLQEAVILRAQQIESYLIALGISQDRITWRRTSVRAPLKAADKIIANYIEEAPDHLSELRHQINPGHRSELDFMLGTSIQYVASKPVVALWIRVSNFQPHRNTTAKMIELLIQGALNQEYNIVLMGNRISDITASKFDLAKLEEKISQHKDSGTLVDLTGHWSFQAGPFYKNLNLLALQMALFKELHDRHQLRVMIGARNGMMDAAALVSDIQVVQLVVNARKARRLRSFRKHLRNFSVVGIGKDYDNIRPEVIASIFKQTRTHCDLILSDQPYDNNQN